MRPLIDLVSPDGGEVLLEGGRVGREVSLRALRRQVQMVFQDRYAAHNPRLTMEEAIALGPRVNGTGAAEATRPAHGLLDRVGLDPRRFAGRYPQEMSGGMRQRAMIALALACRPKLLLADEPTTALDATVQIQVLLLLRELQRAFGMGMIFVTHDIGVAVEGSDRVAVMQAGRFVETGPIRDIMRDPQHPYTRGLLAANLHGAVKGQRLDAIPGAPPPLDTAPVACPFAPRCPVREPRCETEPPPLALPGPGRTVRCIHAAA